MHASSSPSPASSADRHGTARQCYSSCHAHVRGLGARPPIQGDERDQPDAGVEQHAETSRRRRAHRAVPAVERPERRPRRMVASSRTHAAAPRLVLRRWRPRGRVRRQGARSERLDGGDHPSGSVVRVFAASDGRLARSVAVRLRIRDHVTRRSSGRLGGRTRGPLPPDVRAGLRCPLLDRRRAVHLPRGVVRVRRPSPLRRRPRPHRAAGRARPPALHGQRSGLAEGRRLHRRRAEGRRALQQAGSGLQVRAVRVERDHGDLPGRRLAPHAVPRTAAALSIQRDPPGLPRPGRVTQPLVDPRAEPPQALHAPGADGEGGRRREQPAARPDGRRAADPPGTSVHKTS